MDLSTRFYCLCMMVTAVTGFIYNNSVPGLNFGEMTTFLNTPGYVYHMEEDHLNSDTIIYSSGKIINSTRCGQIVSVESGDPNTYSVITGFVQLDNPYKILMVDSRFHCIRLLDRTFNNVSTAYGECGSPGSVDAYNQDARFLRPSEIVRSPFHINTVYVLSSSGHGSRIRFINMSTGEVGTKSLPGFLPINLAIDRVQIIFGSGKAIYVTDDIELQPILISGSEARSSSYPDGRLQTALYANLRNIISIEDGVYIAADRSTLRVIDTVRKFVSSICTTDNPPADGPISSCRLDTPNSLVLIGNRLFVGGVGGIKYISIRTKGFENGTIPQMEANKTCTTLYVDTTETGPTLYVDTTETGPTPRTKTTETKPLNIAQIFPLYGPVAGETWVKLTLKDEELLGVDRSFITITMDRRPVQFNRSITQNEFRFMSLPSNTENRSVPNNTDRSSAQLEVNISQETDQSLINWILEREFEYKPNPVLTNVFPRRSILSGGTKITISGRFMDSVFSPVMIVFLSQNGEIIKRYYSNCLEKNGSQSICKTPNMTEEIQKLLNASSKLQSDGEDIVDALLQEIQSAENSLENSDFMGTSDTGEHQRRFARQTFSKQELNANGITITFGFTFDGVQEYKDLTKHPRLSHVANLEIDRDPQVKSFEEQGLNKMLHFNPAKDRILHITGDHLDVNGAISDEYYIEIGEGGICHIKSLDRKLITCSPPTESPEAAEKNYVIYKRKKTPHVQVNIGNIHSSVGYIYYETNFWVDKEWIRITTFTMSAVLFLIILAVIVFKVWQRNKSPSDDKAMSEMRVVTNHEGTNVKDKVDVGPFLGRKLNPEIRSKVDDCRIDMKRLHLGDRAGKGNFGEVYKGQLTSLLGNRQAVVVKTLKDDKEVNFHDFEDFLKEATILLDFKHSNVLSLIGVVCEEGNRPLIVLPYMEHGDLHRLISDDSFDMGLVDMVQFAYQIANGMFYLSKQRFVHRDLAARNCLVDSNYVVKISDFGMSRDVYDRDYYVMENRQKPLPMRWMAIESLREGRYTTKSDVWSFGVTMWELLTRGSTPYPGIPNSDIKKHICAGQKLEQPEACPSTIYEVMLNCWEYKPDSRTNFSEISQFLDLLLRSNKQEPSKGIHLCEKSYRSATR